MSEPRDGRGRDAFDDFFGDPHPSGSTKRSPEVDADSQPTQGVEIPDDATVAEPSSRGQEGPATSAVPTGAVPEDWWTSDSEPSQPATGGGTWYTSSTPPPAQPAGHGPRRGMSPFGLVALLVGGVLLGGLCVGGAVVALNQDDDTAATQTTVTETSSETSSDTSSDPETSSDTSSETSSDSSTSSSSSTTSSSSSSSPTRSGELPAGVSRCAGPSSGISVGRGTDVTSCDFAIAVRDAYIAAGPDGAASLEVRSPVTSRSYSMSCSGDSVTRCTGGNNAVVVLY